MSLVAQLVWVQIGGLGVKSHGFCYQSSKLPIPPGAKQWLIKGGKNYLIQLINTLLANIILYKIWTTLKVATFYCNIWNICEENVPNPTFCKLLWIVSEKIHLHFRGISCLWLSNNGSMMDWVTPSRSPMNTVFGLCQIILQTWLLHSLLTFLWNKLF